MYNEATDVGKKREEEEVERGGGGGTKTRGISGSTQHQFVETGLGLQFLSLCFLSLLLPLPPFSSSYCL